jgi:hypothetical protein
MDRKPMTSRLSLLLLPLLLGGLALSTPLKLAAQVPVDENGEPLSALDDEGYADVALQDIPSLTTAELEELVGPVALYPDELLAIVLPASTYPLEIVQAVRFLDDFETDGSLEPDESWDESVVALLNYPEVIRMLDREIDWTWRLGEAVIGQQTDLIAAVESFRDRAYAAGNLESDEHQTVSIDDGVIEIDPVDEKIIYVPYYEPEEVVVYQPQRVYHYYPQAYPVYYYPYPYGHSFASGYFWGVTTAFTIGWSNNYLHVYHPSYWGHPYYGHHYYGHYYRHASISVYNHWYVHNSYRSSTHHYRDGDHWRPHNRSGARPATQGVRNYQYPSGSRNDYRASTGSSGRSRQDYQDRNQSSSERNRLSSSGDNRRTRITANAARQNRDSNADSRSAIRFRNRADGDTIRADRGDNSRRSSSSDRQRLIARNSRQSNADTRATQNRPGSQRSVPVRQVSTRTSSRSGASQRSASQRTVQRQAPVQRQVTRATVQRQAPIQRQAARATAQRQAPVARQTAPSSNRGQSGVRPQRQASSSRGNARRQRPQ